MSFKLQHREEKGIVILTPQGQLNASEVVSFKKEIAPFLQKEGADVIVDCSALEFVDSTGLGALIALLRKLEAKGGKLFFVGLGPEVASIFEITRLHKLFQIYPTLQIALEKILVSKT